MKALSRIAVPLVILAACLLLAVNWLLAQEPQPSRPLSQSVTLTMIAIDNANHAIDDLRQDEIQLVEDNQPRPISLFSKDARPTDYALVIDNSGSFKPLLGPIAEAAKILVSANQPEDETFVESFANSATIETTQEFTSDKAKLNAALDSLYIRQGQTAVIDAIYLAVKHTAEYKGGPSQRRRAVVLFTDGEDRNSYYRDDQLVKLLRENDVQVFVVGIVYLLDKQRGLIRKSPREAAEGLLNRIAEQSGGRAFFPRKIQELSGVMAEIAHDLHFQYLIEFERQAKLGEKGFRKVKVKIASRPGQEKSNVIIRPGYLVKTPDMSSKPKEKTSP
jgi:Ca-activated chloride channel family protein